MELTWNLETRNIRDLKDYAHNPRKATKQQIAKIKESIDSYGLIDKPIINMDNTIIAGHQRVAIYRSRRAKKIDVWVPVRMLTDDEVRDLNMRHNKATASWDYDLLANHFDVSELEEFGFSELELGLMDIDTVQGEIEPSKSLSHCDIVIQFARREDIGEELIDYIKSHIDQWGAIKFQIK